MLFNSIVFLYGFLPLAYFVYWKLHTANQRYIWLTICGYVFYGSWNYQFCALMAFSTLVSYAAGRGMIRWDRDVTLRRLCLIVPVVTDLALLGYFKYAGFAAQTLQAITTWAGHPWTAPVMHVVLPLGISFYTFHTISYIVDAYRRVVVPTKNFWEFSCYVCLFCQLVAGPIVRFRQIEGDLANISSAHRNDHWERGCSFFALGMLKKVLLADTIAAVIDPALEHYTSLSTASAWLVMLGYTFQIYFDFSGYSDMATGLGALFGLRIPQNFDSPYKAVNPSDFWRRWHISLSTCMRDYVYVPLGGSRRMHYRNLLLTMLIGGIWHGANWTFVLWGAYHGILLAAYTRYRTAWEALPVAVARVLMFVLVVIGWVPFRATSLAMTKAMLAHMFVFESGASIVGARTLFVTVLVAAVIVTTLRNTFELSHQWSRSAATGIAALFALSIAVIYGGVHSPFLYFQF